MTDYDELAKEFMQNMRTIQASGKHIQDGLRGEMFVLFFIKKMGGKTVPGQISSAIGVSSARIAAALNSLEEKGLITREIDNEDRRKIIVELTREGEAHAEEERKKHIEKIKTVLEALGEEDAKDLVRIVGRLGEVL